MVMLHHMTVLAPGNALDRWVGARAEMGSAGVDLFFVLSGFLITGILVDSRGRSRYFRNFYARRTLRIFPLYYAVVAFSLLILPHIPNPKTANFGRIAGDEIWYWLYLSNFSIAAHNAFRHAILDISWSLAIEEQFYLIWPAVVFFLSPRQLKRVCFALIAVAPLIRAVAAVNGTGWIAIYVLTPMRVDALAYGALVAILLREGGLLEWRRAAWWLGIISAAIWVGTGLTTEAYREVAAAQVVVYSATGICFSSMLVLVLTAHESSPARRIFRNRGLITLGLYSYGLYLFHLPLRAVVRDTFFGPARFPRLGGSALPGQFLFYAIAIAASFLVAYASWHLYEKWFLRLKRRFGSSEAVGSPRAATVGPSLAGGIEGDPSATPSKLPE